MGGSSSDCEKKTIIGEILYWSHKDFIIIDCPSIIKGVRISIGCLNIYEN